MYCSFDIYCKSTKIQEAVWSVYIEVENIF